MSQHRHSRSVIFAAWLAFVLGAAGCGRVDPEAELAAATANLAAGNYNEAAIRLNNVVQVQPDNAEARRLRGELALVLGEYASAAEELERARALGAPLDSIAAALADALTVLGRTEQALTLLDEVPETPRGDPSYWTLRAEAFLGAGRAAEAELALDAGEEAGDARGARVQIARARLAFARGDAAAAEALLEQALRATPDDPRVLTARADLFARTDRLTESANDLQRVVDIYRSASLTGREVSTLMALAQVHLARNDLEAVGTTAARLAEQAPQAILTAYLGAVVEYSRGNFDEAAALIQPLVNEVPDAGQLRALLGAIHLAQGNLGQAEQQLQLVLASSPGDPAAVKLLAETRLRQQRPEAALTALQAVSAAAADDPQIGFLSGLASLLSGNTEQGILYLEQAASLDPANEMVKLQLARAYLAAGRDAEAAALMQGAFGGGPARLEAGLLQLFADMRRGAADSGEAAAAALLAEFPREPRALTAVAIYSQVRGDNRRARELFEQAAELETEGAAARLILASALLQEGRSQEAEQLLARVVEQQPANAQALTALAELLIARGDFAEAARLLRQAAENTASISPRLALAQLLIRQGDLAAAKVQLDEAANAAPESPEVAAIQGLLALAEGRPEEAATLLRTAEASLPNRLGVALALAHAELASGQPDAARATLRRVLMLAPESLPLRFALGEAELQLGNAGEALSVAAALKAEFPTQSAGYRLEADTQIAARRYAAAADSMSMAFERERTWPVLTRWLGALQLAGRPAEALRATEEWVAANPAHVAGALTLAGLLQDARRYEEALRAYQAVLNLDRANLIALNNGAWLARELAAPGALALAERAHQLAPDNPAVLDTLGWVLLAENREQEAVAYLSRAAELAPSAPVIRYHLAEAMVALGRSAEARSVLTTLLREDGDFEERADVQRLLDAL